MGSVYKSIVYKDHPPIFEYNIGILFFSLFNTITCYVTFLIGVIEPRLHFGKV